jgi:hypothetical protein
VIDYNTASGVSVGVLAEGGVTAFGVSVSGGKEVGKNLSSGSMDNSKIGFVGVGPISGLAGMGKSPELGALIGDHSGVGAYVVPSFINGCSGN